jgi:hypothetical protein
MSGTLLVLEAVGISAAAVGVVLAQNPPEDLRSWWDRQEWLHTLVMPMGDDAAKGLSILPGRTTHRSLHPRRPHRARPRTP